MLGLGPLDWILGKLVGAIADSVKDSVVPLIEGPIRAILQDSIDDTLPPIPAKIILKQYGDTILFGGIIEIIYAIFV